MEKLRAVGEMSGKSSDHSVLRKWNSCAHELAVPSEVPEHAITKLHIYDFDNTLFATPGPTEQLYTRELLGKLTSSELPNGGWWNEPEFLQAAIEISRSKPRRFSWNEGDRQIGGGVVSGQGHPLYCFNGQGRGEIPRVDTVCSANGKKPQGMLTR